MDNKLWDVKHFKANLTKIIKHCLDIESKLNEIDFNAPKNETLYAVGDMYMSLSHMLNTNADQLDALADFIDSFYGTTQNKD